VVVDAGVTISALHEAGIERSLIRLATTFTARRSSPRPSLRAQGEGWYIGAPVGSPV